MHNPNFTGYELTISSIPRINSVARLFERGVKSGTIYVLFAFPSNIGLSHVLNIFDYYPKDTPLHLLDLFGALKLARQLQWYTVRLKILSYIWSNCKLLHNV